MQEIKEYKTSNECIINNPYAVSVALDRRSGLFIPVYLDRALACLMVHCHPASSARVEYGYDLDLVYKEINFQTVTEAHLMESGGYPFPVYDSLDELDGHYNPDQSCNMIFKHEDKGLFCVGYYSYSDFGEPTIKQVNGIAIGDDWVCFEEV